MQDSGVFSWPTVNHSMPHLREYFSIFSLPRISDRSLFKSSAFVKSALEFASIILLSRLFSADAYAYFLERLFLVYSVPLLYHATLVLYSSNDSTKSKYHLARPPVSAAIGLLSLLCLFAIATFVFVGQGTSFIERLITSIGAAMLMVESRISLDLEKSNNGFALFIFSSVSRSLIFSFLLILTAIAFFLRLAPSESVFIVCLFYFMRELLQFSLNFTIYRDSLLSFLTRLTPVGFFSFSAFRALSPQLLYSVCVSLYEPFARVVIGFNFGAAGVVAYEITSRIPRLLQSATMQMSRWKIFDLHSEPISHWVLQAIHKSTPFFLILSNAVAILLFLSAYWRLPAGGTFYTFSLSIAASTLNLTLAVDWYIAQIRGSNLFGLYMFLFSQYLIVLIASGLLPKAPHQLGVLGVVFLASLPGLLAYFSRFRLPSL
jgi:hypothetical protein